MTTLKEIRAKFPQYSDLSDDQLAGALHQKYYSDMPRPQFDAKIGFAPAAERGADEGLMRIQAGIPGNTEQRGELARRDAARSQEAAAEKARFAETRTPLQRLAGTAAFAADMPFRTFTQGRKGFADALSAVGSESAASSVRKQQQDFARANPDLMWTLGAMGEVAPGVPALSTMGALGRLPPGYSMKGQLNAMRAQNAADDLGSFQRQNVRPPAPAFASPPVANASRGVADMTFVGAPLANAMDDSLMGVARASEEIARRYGSVPGAEQAGRTVRQGLERYRDDRGVLPPGTGPGTPDYVTRSRTIAAPTRETSMKSKQTALYDRAWSMLPARMRQGRAKDGDPRFMVQFPQTRELLGEIQARNQRMVVGNDKNNKAPVIETGGFTGKVVEALGTKNWIASIETARNIRSRMRRMIADLPANERSTLFRSDIRRIENAITRDIIGSLRGVEQRFRAQGRNNVADNVARSINSFRRADQYTRASFNRLDRVARIFNAADDAALYRGIVTAARNGDMSKLRSLRMMLRGSEMDELSSSIIGQLGTPVASARGVVRDVGFSPSTFSTNWNKLVESNPQALNLLFPNRSHRQALTDLAAMSRRLANVEAMRNSSQSATTAANVGMITGGGATYAAGGLETLLAGAASGLAFSTLMSRPATARWLVRFAELKSAAAQNPAMAPQLQAHVAALGAMAAKDTALADVYQDVLKGEGAR